VISSRASLTRTEISYPPTPVPATVPCAKKLTELGQDSSLPTPRKMENAFARPVDQVLSTLGVQTSAGLTDAQVKKATEKYGKNGRFASYHKAPGPGILTETVKLLLKSLLRRSGSSSSSSSRINSSSSSLAPLPCPSSWPCSRTKAAGAHLSIPSL
jgi:hypothetical protein